MSSASGLLSALAAAGSNGEEDVIQVVQGTYVGNFVYNSSEAYNLSIEGGYVAGCASRVVDPANTVLDGMGLGSVLTLSSEQEADLVIDGLVLQNGSGTNGRGGGLFASIKGSLTLTNNIIDSNNISISSSYNSGGGIYITGATMVTLTNNTISNNTARGRTSNGGGIYVYNTTTVFLTNNTISNNRAIGSYGGNGGGFYASDVAIVILTNNAINGNSGNTSTAGGIGSGGGIYISASVIIITAILTNNIINDNSISGHDGIGGGIHINNITMATLINNTISNNSVNNYSGSGGGIWLTLYSDNDNADIYNNIIWNNSAGFGTDLYLDNDGNRNLLPSTVNLFNNDFDQSAKGIFITLPFVIDSSNLDNLDPLFVDAANGDYHLQAGSPVINKGDNDAPGIPDTDKDGNLRIAEGVVDMSAYEYGSEPAFILTVTKAGEGSGTVTSSPAGINCGSDCSGGYSLGTVVTLAATADPGSTFEGWSGDSDCLDGQLTMDADKTCTATFSAVSMLSVSPTSLDFGEVEVNSSKDLTFTVTNSGGETLTGSASTSVPFSIVSGGSFSLGAKQSQTVTVRFSPTTTGTFMGQVSLSSNGGDTTVVVTGTEIVIPVLSVTPTTLDFGKVLIGSSRDLTFTVTNTGTGTLEGSASTSAPFSVVSGGTFSLGAGASQTVTVRFSPTSTTTFLGDVSISSNGGNATVSLSGTGTVSGECSYAISPTSQSFEASGGTGSISVTAPGGCNWTAVSNDSWISITSGSSGSGDSTVSYSVAANSSTDQRTGTITIQDQTFTVMQGGSGTFDNWTPLPVGGMTSSGPAVAVYNGELNLVVRWTDNRVYHTRFTSGAWAEWTSLGGLTSSKLAAVEFNGELWVFGRGIGNRIYFNRVSGQSWSGWRRVPGRRVTFSGPEAVIFNNELYLFARGIDDRIYLNRFDGSSFSGWSEVPPGEGLTLDTPAAAVFEGTLYLFVRGTDNRIYNNRLTQSGWTGWSGAGSIRSTPSGPAAESFNGELWVFVRGMDDRIYQSRLTGGSWIGSSEVAGGGLTPSGPGAAATASTLYLVVRGIDDGIYLNQTSAGER